MSHIRTDASDPDDNDDKPNRPTYIRATDIERTQRQVGTLLAVLEKSSELLYSETEVGTVFDVDDEAKAEARKTYSLAHAQLRNVIDEQARWSLAERKLDQLSEKILKESLRDLKGERKRLAEELRPSSRMNPNIRLFEVGWVAWYGQELPNPASLHGIGNSPEEALRAFDKAFHLRRAVQAIPQPAEPAAKPGLKTRKPKPKPTAT